MLTNQTVEENADKRTQYKPEKVNNLKYSKTKLPWFSCLLQHSARTRGGLILQRSRAHTGRQVSECFDIDATGAVPGLKPDATAIEDPQDGKLKVKFSHTRYRALGPELIPVYRQSARR